MKIKHLTIIFLAIILSACGKDSANSIEETIIPLSKSEDKEILGFKFLKSDNSNLNQDYTISINQSDLSLDGSLPFKTDLKNLIPTIEISSKATISPSSKTALDLESPVEFTVTAENETINKYVLSVTLNENDEAKILSFTFLSADNNDGTIFGQIHEDIIGEINDEENTVVLAVPTGTEISELVPTIATSEFSTITPENKDSFNFSQPITYTVTSQSGIEQEYEVSLSIGLKPDRQLLMELDALNPNNTLGWDFSVEHLNDLPYVGAVGSYQKVNSLELQERNIKYFPQGMNGFTYLSTLNLGSNSLESIPEEIYEILGLKNLYLQQNNISIIDKEIENLQYLTSLNLDYNQLTSLPDEITKITPLISLFISNNNLTELPVNIGNLTQLESFYIDGNQLTSLPASTSQLINVWRMSVSRNNFNEFPNSILSLTKLVVFSIDENNISTIPSSIGNLTLLEGLTMEKNNIQALPIEINALSKLKNLFLAENNIAVFPEQINLPLLEYLNLRDNPISTIPANITAMSNLLYLQLADTDITSIPVTIGDLTNLNYLYLDGNSLTSIPSQIGNLTNLTHLDIGRNSLNSIPQEIGNLSNLATINIAHNPLTIIPAEICDLVSTNNLIIQKDDNDICE